MKLRKLKLKDAPYMLEWMHDESVVRNLKADFRSKTLQDCQDFIVSAVDTTRDMHLAIVDEDDCYMGTISLKHIAQGMAEFGIAIRTCAMGKGYAKIAMKSIIKVARKELSLNAIYWCVDPQNARALRFYDKNGYQRVTYEEIGVRTNYTEDEIQRYVWYQVMMNEKKVYNLFGY